MKVLEEADKKINEAVAEIADLEKRLADLDERYHRVNQSSERQERITRRVTYAIARISKLRSVINSLNILKITIENIVELDITYLPGNTSTGT